MTLRLSLNILWPKQITKYAQRYKTNKKKINLNSLIENANKTGKKKKQKQNSDNEIIGRDKFYKQFQNVLMYFIGRCKRKKKLEIEMLRCASIIMNNLYDMTESMDR